MNPVDDDRAKLEALGIYAIPRNDIARGVVLESARIIGRADVGVCGAFVAAIAHVRVPQRDRALEPRGATNIILAWRFSGTSGSTMVFRSTELPGVLGLLVDADAAVRAAIRASRSAHRHDHDSRQFDTERRRPTFARVPRALVRTAHRHGVPLDIAMRAAAAALAALDEPRRVELFDAVARRAPREPLGASASASAPADASAAQKAPR